MTNLVTKDVNLRVKAKAIGLVSLDYKNDHVSNIQKIYNGCKIIENIDPELISKIYKPPYELDSSLVENFSELIPNEYLVIRNEKKICLGML